MVSDFVEDLPPGRSPIKLQLSGERVLLLHRTGVQRTPVAIADHLNRITRWTEALRQAGAASVSALPISAVTCERLMRTLGNGSRAGTDVVVLQNLPDTAQPDVLKTIAGTLSAAARDWPSPVTVSWADVREEPQPPWQMPPVELVPHLIKASVSAAGGCETEELDLRQFTSILSEVAGGMRRFLPGAKRADIAAALRLYASAGTLDSQHLFLIISNFLQTPDAERYPELDLSGVRIVMLPAPTREDAPNEAAYFSRVSGWERWLRQRHATVCRIPLNGIPLDGMPSSLLGCIHGN
jgi:hypothetical protein